MDRPAPQAILLSDYAPPAFLVDTVDLHFDLDPDATVVRSRLAVRRNPARADAAALVLDGRELELVSVALDGRALGPADYRLDAEALTLPLAAAAATVEVVTRVRPAKNLSFMGLYCSNGNFFTQCEAEGFRKITYFPDRPDVMARYSVTIVGRRDALPVLLSNGNCVAQRALPDGRHEAKWVDPFAKPSYLFALVAGRFACHEDTIRTRSGATKRLQIYVEPKDAAKTAHAMASLKKSIRWDERRFGLELDLDQYMIVAVGDFNMGAMENKGLNVFNTRYVLADAATATDADYDGIESVIAHEYFHNWTGNRVTCRDWFQLSLKEGLTVFRDQEFSMDMSGSPSGRAVRRIGDVRVLRSAQFPEDAGPMAHPVRPDAYMEINNFYTVTIYEKGAEVVRMAQTVFGQAGFRKGMDLYFRRHDGQAVTCDDFFAAIADANPGVLAPAERAQWFRWYSQAGTPRLAVSDAYDARARTYTLRLRQSCPPTPGQEHKAPFVVPVTLGLLDADGRALALHLAGERRARGTETTLLATGTDNVFVFTGVPRRPVPSLLRGFSAPVIVDYDYSDAQLVHLLRHDGDPFNRWEAGQRLFLRLTTALARRAAAGQPLAVPAAVADAFRGILADRALDPAFKAEALTLPSETYIAEQFDVVDPRAIHVARVFVRRALARAAAAELRAAYAANAVKGPYSPDPRAAGRRALQGVALGYLLENDDAEMRRRAFAAFHGAGNMTDRMNAIAALMLSDSPERAEALAAFHQMFRDDALVMDKWLALQAGARVGAAGTSTLESVRQLMLHPVFSIKNPNKARALIGTFCHANPACFHADDGSGYDFWMERVQEIDGFNPQVAARLARAAASWKKLEPVRRGLLHDRLAAIAASPALSKDTREVVQKTLA
ncbi:MAG: aminopeptidase N [Burkholderiales bacterium]|nr:aminopeptidase N [Burkholderiales bacterium]